MKSEPVRWIEQAKRDLRVAERTHFPGTRHATIFMCQQAVEKALKAVLIARTDELPQRSHDLFELAREAKLPLRFLPLLRVLNPAYLLTRYPDARLDGGKRLCGAKVASLALQRTGEVIDWAERPL